MKTNKLIPLFVITIIVVTTAVLTTRQPSSTSGREQELLFPSLKGSINDVNEISIQQQQDTLTLYNDGGIWKIREADGFPALFSKIRQTVIALSELRIDSEKTSNPSLYSNLGVENPSSEDAESRLLTLKDAAGKELVSVIAGKNRLSSSAAGSYGLYVRLPEQATALLVEGDTRLDIDADIADWIERDLMDIDPERVNGVTIIHSDGGEVVLNRAGDDGDLVLENVPEGKQARSDYAMTRMKGILEDISIDNVMAASRVSFPEDTTKTTVTTSDGLIAEITSAVIDENNFATFSFRYSAPAVTTQQDEAEETDSDTDKQTEATVDVEQEVADLNTMTSGWVYQIPSYKFDTFTRKLEDLVEDTPEEDPEEESDN